MVFGASRAVGFAGILIAEAGQLIASADAIAVAGFRGCFDGDERHCNESLRFHAPGCKRTQDLEPHAPALRPIGSSALGGTAGTPRFPVSPGPTEEPIGRKAGAWGSRSWVLLHPGA